MDANVLKNIATRRSIRRYRNERINPELVKILLQSAMFAPSAANQQPWSFVVIEDTDTLKALSAVNRFYTALPHAPLAILVCGNPQAAVFSQFWEQDCAAATENILLAAHAIDLGAVWMGINPGPDRETIRKRLNIPQEIEPFAFVSLGYPDEAANQPSDRFDEEKVHYNSIW